MQCQPGLAPLFPAARRRSRDRSRRIAARVPRAGADDESAGDSGNDASKRFRPTCLTSSPTRHSWRSGGNGWRAIAGFKVGIGWQGNPKYVADVCGRFRCGTSRPLARVPGVRLFSLQKGTGSDQTADVRRRLPSRRIRTGFRFPPRDLHGHGRRHAELDLVITSDTAVAHLAGGLGVPVWVPLGFACDWRWLDEAGRLPLVSDDAALPPAAVGRLGGSLRGDCRRTGQSRSWGAAPA